MTPTLAPTTSYLTPTNRGVIATNPVLPTTQNTEVTFPQSRTTGGTSGTPSNTSVEQQSQEGLQSSGVNLIVNGVGRPFSRNCRN